jgi:hypothetical protein
MGVDERVELQAGGGLDSTTEQRVPSSFPRTPVVRSLNDANPLKARDLFRVEA